MNADTPGNEVLENTDAVKKGTASIPIPANGAGGLTFIFSMLCFLFWANMLGLLGDGGVIAIGCVQLGVAAAYLVGACTLLKTGNSFDGNAFLVFAALFGGAGGCASVIGAFAGEAGIAVSQSASGVVWLTLGLLLMLLTPSTKKMPAVLFLIFFVGGISLAFFGLLLLGLLPPSLMPACAWVIFVTGCLALWCAISIFNAYCGVHIPLGKPLFK